MHVCGVDVLGSSDPDGVLMRGRDHGLWGMKILVEESAGLCCCLGSFETPGASGGLISIPTSTCLQLWVLICSTAAATGVMADGRLSLQEVPAPRDRYL